MASGQVVLNGAVNLLTPRQGMAQAGAAFTVTNPTPGTAIAYALQTGFSATANGLFSISNSEPTGGKNIILDKLLLVQTATAATGTLNMRLEANLESAVSAITTLAAARTPVNLNSAASNSSIATVTSFAAGAATVPAAVGTRRLAAIASIPTGVTVAHDSFIFEFGGEGAGGKVGLTAARATDPAQMVTVVNPVVVGPQSTCFLNLWWVTAAANAPSFEFALSWFEL